MYLKFLFHILTAMKRLRASSQIEEDMEEMRVEGKKKLFFFRMDILTKFFAFRPSPTIGSAHGSDGVAQIARLAHAPGHRHRHAAFSAIVGYVRRDFPHGNPRLYLFVFFSLRNQRRLVLFH